MRRRAEVGEATPAHHTFFDKHYPARSSCPFTLQVGEFARATTEKLRLEEKQRAVGGGIWGVGRWKGEMRSKKSRRTCRGTGRQNRGVEGCAVQGQTDGFAIKRQSVAL